MSSGAHLQIYIRGGNLQLLKKHIGHAGVVMLAGMYQTVFDHALSVHTRAVVRGHCSDKRGHLHKIWPGTGYKEQFESGIHHFKERGSPVTSKLTSIGPLLHP